MSATVTLTGFVDVAVSNIAFFAILLAQLSGTPISESDSGISNCVNNCLIHEIE